MSLLVFYYCICPSVAVTVANHLCLVCYHFSCSIITVVTVSRPCCLPKIINYTLPGPSERALGSLLKSHS